MATVTDDMPELMQAENGVTYVFDKKGKVKNVYLGPDNNQILFEFTDHISVFDKVIPSTIPEKGASLCLGTTYWFNQVENAGICNTHYETLITAEKMIAKKFPIIEKPTPETDTYFIPAEFICRHYAAGSLLDRIKDGRVKPKDVGLDHMPENGEKLPQPYFEATTKFEKFDRPLSHKEMYEITGLTKKEFEHIEDTTLKIDDLIARKVEPNGLIHIDGKKEYAFDKGRTLTIVDSFGTGDEDRFVEKEPFEEDGTMIQKSKEYVRQYYRDTGYHAELMAARKAGTKEPEIPALPEEVKMETSRIYKSLFKQLTGQSLNSKTTELIWQQA